MSIATTSSWTSSNDKEMTAQRLMLSTFSVRKRNATEDIMSNFLPLKVELHVHETRVVKLVFKTHLLPP